MPFGEFVHLHMQYYSFASSILKHSAFSFFTPARKPPINSYLVAERSHSFTVSTSTFNARAICSIGT